MKRAIAIAWVTVLLTGCGERSAREILTRRHIEIGGTSLAAAVRSNDGELASLLLEANAELNHQDDEGRTPLMLAARHGRLNILAELLRAGADSSLLDHSGRSALSRAVRNRDPLSVHLLLKDGASSVDAPGDAKSPLLVASVTLNDQNSMRLMLRHGARAGIDQALRLSVARGNYSMTRELLQHSSHADFEMGDGMPALNWATKRGDRPLFEMLVGHGADPNLEDGDGKRPLGYALSSMNTAFFEALIAAGADPNLGCMPGQTPLEFIAATQDDAMFLRLLEVSAIPGTEHLHAAIDANDVDRVRLLLAHTCDIDEPDERGDTPLTKSVQRKLPEIATMLLAHGANVSAVGAIGQQALVIAVATRQSEIVKLLLEDGADPNLILKQPTTTGFRELLANRTMEFYMKHDRRFTPLMMAAALGEGDTIRALMKHGASRSRYTRSYKRYPIAFAAEAGNVLAQQLICGYDPKNRDVHYKVVIDLSRQRATLYKNGKAVNGSRVSTGKAGYRTPTGEYVITHKSRDWTSTIYDVQMPYFMRLSCKAFGMHVGSLPGYPASHGCIRMTHNGAKSFFNTLPRGTPVSIVH